mgnify:CR=1 FL=1
MPSVGDIVLGRIIGKRGKDGSNSYIWVLCPHCQNSRWVYIQNLKKARASQLCLRCSSHQRGKESRAWKGGKFKDNHGYILIYLGSDDFFSSMTKDNRYILEHRLIMAKHLGRCLQSWEIVHHKNGIKDDNHIENLELNTDMGHNQFTILVEKLRRLRIRWDKQREKIQLLQQENKHLLKDRYEKDLIAKGKPETKSKKC